MAVGLAGFVSIAKSDPIPYPDVGTPVAVGQRLIAIGGEVTVQMPATSSASYDDYLYLYQPTPSIMFDVGPPPQNFLFWNHGATGTISLGTFDAGTELIFGLYTGFTYDDDGDAQTPDVFEPLDTWYSGPGDRNADGFVHLYAVNDYGGDPDSTYVAFEDLNGGPDGSGSDWNYQDIEYIFTGVTSVPEPSSLCLFGLGLAVMTGIVARRR